MALLRHATLGTRFRPGARCLVGRGPSCHWVQAHTSVSREHAVLFRDGDAWAVRDLFSRNGTLVRGERVKEVALLEQGSLICFGHSDNAWELVDAGEPAAQGSSADGQVVVGGPAQLVLPGPNGAQAYVSRQERQWLLEWDGDVREVEDGAAVALPDRVWRLELPHGEDSRLAPTMTVEQAVIHLVFEVSRDEEHVTLTVVSGGTRRTLDHRSHIYPLLLLARARIEDQVSIGLDPSEHGWVETKALAEMLKTTPEQVNVWIWRARGQLEKVDVGLAHGIVERRATLGQLRIGFGSITVSRR